MPIKQTVVRALVLVLLYAAAVSWLTWPLGAYITTHHPTLGVSSDFDSLYSAWVLAWQSHVLGSGSLAIADANIYHPEPGALFYGPVAYGALPFFAPVFLLTGNPALASNLLYLGSLTLTAAMLHLVVHAWTRSNAAGVVAGAAFLANRWLLWSFVPRVPHLTVLCYLPLIVFICAAPLRSWWGAALLGCLIVAQGMVDPLYVAPAILVPVTLLALFHLSRGLTRSSGIRLLVVVATAAALVLAAHYPYLALTKGNPQLLSQTLWKVQPLRNVIASPGQLMGYTSPLAIPTLVPVLILVGGVLAILRWRGTPRETAGWRQSLLWLTASIMISLPVNVSWNGTLYALPHRSLIEHWPALGRLIASGERLRVAALIAAALLCGLALAEILRHLQLADGTAPRKRFVRAALVAVLVAVMYGQYEWTVGQPESYGVRMKPAYPGDLPQDSPVLHELRQRRGPTIELPLPAGVIDPWTHATAMYRSIFHWQPLLNGYGSYFPAQFPKLMRLAAHLPDPAALRQLQRETGLRFILVYRRSPATPDKRYLTQREAWEQLAAAGGRADLELLAADDDLLLFRVALEGGGIDSAGRDRRMW